MIAFADCELDGQVALIGVLVRCAAEKDLIGVTAGAEFGASHDPVAVKVSRKNQNQVGFFRTLVEAKESAWKRENRLVTNSSDQARDRDSQYDSKSTPAAPHESIIQAVRFSVLQYQHVVTLKWSYKR